MQVIRDIPIYIQNGWNWTSNAVLSIPRRIASSIIEIDYVQQTIKPWYERNIQPLDRTDYLLLITAIVLSAIALKFALKKYGHAALPLGLCAAGIIIGGCLMLSSRRVQQVFDDQAWEQIDLMRRAVNDFTSNNQDFTAYIQAQAILKKPEFQHLKTDLDRLDEEARKFRKDIAAPQYKDKRDIVQGHLDVLTPKVQGNAQDKQLFEELEEELDHVGTNDQDLGQLEALKQKLKDLQTPQAKTDQPELSQQIDELIKAALGPNFDHTKSAFLEYLKGMQGKLSSIKEVEDLI